MYGSMATDKSDGTDAVGKKGPDEERPLSEMVGTMSNRPLLRVLGGIAGGATAVAIVGAVALASNNSDDTVTTAQSSVVSESSESSEPQTEASEEPSQDTDGDSPSQPHASEPNKGSSGSSGAAGTGTSTSSTTPERGSAHQGAEPRAHGDVYIIREGDTLSAVSALLGVSVDRLVAWNDIVDPNLIYKGSALEIPRR